MNLIGIILDGRYSPEGILTDKTTVRRMVSIDLDKEEERGDVQRFYNATEGKDCWGLGTEEAGWWKIIDAFEFIEPNQDVHENKYPVAYRLTEAQFDKMVAEANA